MTSREQRGPRPIAHVGLIVLLIVLATTAAFGLGMLRGPVSPAGAAPQEGTFNGDLIVGRDNDNQGNPAIQPPGVAANQSLNNTDVLAGSWGNDILIGLLGGDVLDGGAGDDILIGGTEQGNQPNSDIIFGGLGDDINIWAPGDGNDLFLGNQGLDAQIFGVIDRDQANVPTLTGTSPKFEHGIPTANLTGSPGFCTLERVGDPALGYEFLVRFFVRATGAQAVTVRLVGVEQVFCTSKAGGAITYADLTAPNPAFVEITAAQAARLNPTVGRIIR